jgi:hypothetical protein
MEQKTIRAGVLGNEYAIKIRTQGKGTPGVPGSHGWATLERGFKTYSEAITRLRQLLASGNYLEG